MLEKKDGVRDISRKISILEGFLKEVKVGLDEVNSVNLKAIGEKGCSHSPIMLWINIFFVSKPGGTKSYRVANFNSNS